MTEIQTGLLAEDGPAVLFENVVSNDGHYRMPVPANLFGTRRARGLGYGKTPDELRKFGEQLAFLRQPEPPGGWREAIEMLPLLKTVMAMKPKTSTSAPCQEIVLTGKDVDLGKLPIQTCWPNEPAPLITWPLVVTEGVDGKSNVGIYRMQVTGRNTTLMRWLAHRGGAKHAVDAARVGSQSVPAAAVLGAGPCHHHSGRSAPYRRPCPSTSSRACCEAANLR